MSEARVAALDEVTPGRPKLVEAHGVRVVLSRAGDQVYACGDVCTHRGGPLSEGKISKILGGVAGPADIGYDRQGGHVVIPQLTENKLVIVQVGAGTQ